MSRSGQIGKQKRINGDKGCLKVQMSRTLNSEKSDDLNSSITRKQESLRRSLRSLTRRGSHLSIKNLDIKDIKKQFRKRKRSDHQDSAQSMEMKEPTTKKICAVSNMTTIADSSPPSAAKKGVLVQRSVSLRSSLTVKDSDFAKRYRLLPTPTKHRPSKSWSDTVSNNGVSETLSQTEIKRQEAIYEVCSGEENVVADLKLIKEVYYAPMYKLKLMNEYEFMKIFGCLEVLLALHQDLHTKLKNARSSNGTTDSIGDIMLNWFPGLRCYARYCANQFEAKTILDEKLRQGGSVADFLQRCRDSPFSRKLDLWSFLDSPRSRLVKYPLMLRSIQKYTPKDHSDWRKLEQAICRLQDIIEEVDRKTGEAKCQDVLSRIVFLDDRQMCPEVFKSRKLLCNGTLRNKHGTPCVTNYGNRLSKIETTSILVRGSVSSYPAGHKTGQGQLSSLYTADPSRELVELKIFRMVTPEWAAPSRPRYQDLVQLNTFLESPVLTQRWANLTRYKPPLNRTKNSGSTQYEA
ncbi:hypothetical protein ACROYT_G019677 [Oculina patagonica]